LNDLERESAFSTLAFRLENGDILPIATTRPELLPACVAVFVHPEDPRYQTYVGQRVIVPLFGHAVPILADPGADPETGTGAVMCCTFGDMTDVDWWYTHKLPLVEAIDQHGYLMKVAGEFAGLSVTGARLRCVAVLDEHGLLLGRKPIVQSVRVHERCDTPVEYLVTQQWFIRVLDFKQDFLEAGERIVWHPPHMKTRYLEWVEHLRWDWAISRQRYFGVPFPMWYCDACDEVIVADAAQLPVNPAEQPPARPCTCGSTAFTPERDVMDTWATSSLTPQIVGRWLAEPDLYTRVFPMSLRPQAHEIIRTWAFYTIVKSYHHFGVLPWKEVAISGWGLAPEGTGKISKSRGGGPIAPMSMIERYSADAVRYWAASTGFGKDAVISEDKIQIGAKLVTKLWNVARFSQHFLTDYRPPAAHPDLAPADRWILSRAQRLIRRVTELFSTYDYAAAKSEIETFFWRDLADNYIELAKQRLYAAQDAQHEGARYTLYHVLLTIIKLFAPFLPYVTEEIYQALFASRESTRSLHRARWPITDETLENHAAEAVGDALVDVATAVRRYKSEHKLSLGVELKRLQLTANSSTLVSMLQASVTDIKSVTRAQQVEVVERLDPDLEIVNIDQAITMAIAQ
jgi:valyl-tRNA synthetase